MSKDRWVLVPWVVPAFVLTAVLQPSWPAARPSDETVRSNDDAIFQLRDGRNDVVILEWDRDAMRAAGIAEASYHTRSLPGRLVACYG